MRHNFKWLKIPVKNLTVKVKVFISFVYSLNSRYGTVAVPNILVFYNAKAVARFNKSERVLEKIVGFVSNITGWCTFLN